MRHVINSAVLAPVILFLSVNILLLDIAVFSRRPAEGAMDSARSTERTQNPVAIPVPQEEITDEPALPTSTPFIIQAQAEDWGMLPHAREYYITLGSGSVQSTEWMGVVTAEAYVDTDKYPPIKQAYFEAYISIPTGNGQVFAKLFNITDKHDVWFSEVVSIGHEVTRHEVPIQLETGNKLYRVMLKATLPYEVVIDNARIKIVTE